MPGEDDKRFITLPGIGLVTGTEAEAFFEEEAMVAATNRRQDIDQLLHTCGFKPLQSQRSGPLAAVAALLGSEEADMLDESGSLLISAEATLRKSDRSDIYFLGLNPGGPPAEDYSIFNNFPTVYESLAMSRMGVSGWDQDWSRKGARFEPGEAPLQTRFKHIARFLGLSYGEIFATNLVFARSSRFKALPRVEDQIQACLPAHKLMIDIVKPKRLWVMGNTDSAGDALKLHKDVQWIKARYQEKNDWSIGHGTVDFCGHTMMLCHTPHLSFWDATAADRQDLLEFAFYGTLSKGLS